MVMTAQKYMCTHCHWTRDSLKWLILCDVYFNTIKNPGNYGSYMLGEGAEKENQKHPRSMLGRVNTA